MSYPFKIASLIILAASVNFAIANSSSEKKILKTVTPITASAYHIQSALNGRGNWYYGHVRLHFGRHIQISASKVLVKTDEQHKISECVIYGEGVLQEGDHYTRFNNGVFSPKTLHLSAQETHKIR